MSVFSEGDRVVVVDEADAVWWTVSSLFNTNVEGFMVCLRRKRKGKPDDRRNVLASGLVEAGLPSSLR